MYGYKAETVRKEIRRILCVQSAVSEMKNEEVDEFFNTIVHWLKVLSSEIDPAEIRLIR